MSESTLCEISKTHCIVTLRGRKVVEVMLWTLPSTFRKAMKVDQTNASIFNQILPTKASASKSYFKMKLFPPKSDPKSVKHRCLKKFQFALRLFANFTRY